MNMECSGPHDRETSRQAEQSRRFAAEARRLMAAGGIGDAEAAARLVAALAAIGVRRGGGPAPDGER